jgi:hypothetical protein
MGYLPSNHVDILEILIVRTGLNDENLGIGILGESRCHHAAGSSATIVGTRLISGTALYSADH